ncbi:MAG: sigma-54 dependent transcriptional regulator [Colwellia sp.]|nr:sigma-54 dependent transcriptional regulator [Colwellia sp.]MCW8863484.1 sigma-54 dependent transcriptional regulator [Colwellia sp.]MCW9079918.1 sigma-54 dependent transcriptional regulator [Colwellia sp.]
MKHSIIIADDDTRVIAALKLFLKANDYDVTAVTRPDELLRILERRDFSVALIDLNYQKDTTSGKEGLQLISDIKSIDEQLPVVVMTGYGSIDTAVQAMKLGAADFIQKPWGNDRLLTVLQAQIRIRGIEQKSAKLAGENAFLKDDLIKENSGIISQSPAMQQVIEQLTKFAQSDMNILLTGENGTGKSLLASYIHKCSRRSDNALVSVNMGAISENLFESEMFGHVKGAFTDAKENRVGRFEVAEGGTLFLDEIANIPLSQQAKLLRVLEEYEFERVGCSKTKQVDVRFVSATNAPLMQLIDEGKFRQDLLYRLNTVEVKIPSLRERSADIIPLSLYFLNLYAQKYRLPCDDFEDDAKLALQAYTWPGNIRELSHMIERSIFINQGSKVSVEALGLNAQGASDFDIKNSTLDDIEKHIIIERLQRFKNDPNKSAQSLGLSRSSYYRRLDKHDL